MAEYSYSQLSQMQKEAAERVREMRRRAKFAAEDAAKQFDAPHPGQDGADVSQQGWQTTCVADKSRPCCKGQMCKKDNTARQIASTGLQTTDDVDRALILSLCFLLQAEKADEELILAMLYVLC